MLQCQVLKIPSKFGNKFENTGYDGSKNWTVIHNEMKKIGCPFCRDKGIRLGHGLHDSVNVHLDKKTHFPKDLQFLFDHVSWSLQKVKGKKLKCSLCN